jgi:hypothetical protein
MIARVEIETGREQALVVKQRLSKKEAPAYYENDISAESQTKEKGARFQKEDAHEKRPQCFEEKTGKGKKETHGISVRQGPRNRSFCFMRDLWAMAC